MIMKTVTIPHNLWFALMMFKIINCVCRRELVVCETCKSVMDKQNSLNEKG